MTRTPGALRVERARQLRAQMLALVIADTTITDLETLADESPAFWEVTARFATALHRPLTVSPPTDPANVGQVIAAVRAIRRSREISDDALFDAFPKDPPR